MRKNNILVRSALIVTFALYLVVSGCIRNYGIPTNMSYTHLKAVSLRELQKKIIQRDIQELPEMKSFYGITRLYGFLWDEEGRDLVLFGEADAEKPNLHFDDFVVSLRNAYCLYCQREGNTMYYSDPSITIDPDPNTTQLLDKLTEENEGDDPELNARAWQELCKEPQKVGVFGIPFSSHLAAVMVEADYILKDVVNGNYEVEIEGEFKSLHQLRREFVEESMKTGSEIHLGSPLNRFEFTAPEAYFRNSDNLFLHYSQPVILITEEEYVTDNSISGKGRADPLAKKFANDFNKNFREISKAIPIYETLAQSYTVFAIAKEIRESNLVMDTSFFHALFNYYPLDEYNVPATLPGRSLVDQVTYSTAEGFTTQTLFSCGGVNLGTKPRRSMVNAMKGKEIMNNILMVRPTPDAVHWSASKVQSGSWTLRINGMGLVFK